jgi:hypothetical protein
MSTNLLNFTCGTCGRDAATPRIVRRDGAIYEGCVDATHEGFTAAIAADHPDYAAWMAQARAAGITGRVYSE